MTMPADLESRCDALEERLHKLEELQDGDRATLRLHGLLHEQSVEVQREHELRFQDQRNQLAEFGGRLRKLLTFIAPRSSYDKP
ncbi:hypothetical protein [Flindersiella endophytica]